MVWFQQMVLRSIVLGVGLGFISLPACAQTSNLPVWKVKAVAEYPHDSDAFTQGLVIEKGQLYEGTGQQGKSTLRKVELTTGKVQQSESLPAQYFGEGITIFEGKIYQLTWKDAVGVIYDLDSMKGEKVFHYTGEGWGLTHNGKHLILSDGSYNLRFYDPKNMKLVKTLQVKDKKNRIKSLNELEYVKGEVWANIWYEDRVARISPETGQVLGWIDMSNLIPQSRRDKEAVLNGIAYDADNDKIYVTGKNWPKLFQIEIVK
ncbi:MAG: glutaminyl-peptide cyclotransferase [Pirellulales bacterium]